MNPDIGGDRERSRYLTLVEYHQHSIEWSSGGCDNDCSTLRGRGLGFSSEFQPRLYLHRNLHQCDPISRWSGIHRLRSSSQAAFLRRRSFRSKISDDLGVCTRQRRTNIQVSFLGQFVG